MKALDLLEQHRPQIEALCRKYGVVRLFIFGSALSEAWNPASSDYDFLADFGPPPVGVNLFKQQFGLVADLEQALGRSVNVVDWKAIRKPIFRQVVEAQAQEFYAA